MVVVQDGIKNSLVDVIGNENVTRDDIALTGFSDTRRRAGLVFRTRTLLQGGASVDFVISTSSQGGSILSDVIQSAADSGSLASNLMANIPEVTSLAVSSLAVTPVRSTSFAMEYLISYRYARFICACMSTHRQTQHLLHLNGVQDVF